MSAIALWVGRSAQSWGRRPLLMISFMPLFIRSGVFAWSNDPAILIAVQLLDGFSAATLGVLVPLVVADTMRAARLSHSWLARPVSFSCLRSCPRRGAG